LKKLTANKFIQSAISQKIFEVKQELVPGENFRGEQIHGEQVLNERFQCEIRTGSG